MLAEEDELEAKALELKELTSQLEEVKGRLADVSEHRDAALRKAKALEAREAPAGASAPVVPVRWGSGLCGVWVGRSEASGKVEEEVESRGFSSDFDEISLVLHGFTMVFRAF